MSQASNRKHGKKSLRPRLAKLAERGPGEFRLNWLGALSPGPANAPFSYTIASQFVGVGDNAGRIETIDLPLGQLPLLAANTLWRDGVFAGFQPGKSGSFRVDMGTYDETLYRAKSPFSLLPASSYPLHRIAGPCYCRVFPTLEGRELIVPSWEIIRTWYLFDSRIIPVVLAGAIAHPETVHPRYVPWRPEETHLMPPNGAKIVHADRLSTDVALCLARLILDPDARKCAVFLHQRIKSKSGQPFFELPPVLPPFRCMSKWEVDYVEIPAHGSEPARLLVTCLRSTKEPMLYEEIDARPVTSFEQAPHAGSNLPYVHRNTTRIELPDEDALDLYGSGEDPSLEGASVTGLFFGNSALNVKVVRPKKEEQRYRSGGKDESPVPIHGASVDPTALETPGIAPLSSSNTARADDRQKTHAHVLQIAPLFGDVLRDIEAHPSMRGWRGDFPFGAATLRVHSSKRNTKRGFIVARLSNGLRHVYIFDAETLTDSEGFRVIFFERRYGGILKPEHLTMWLSGFPHRPGCPWECEDSQNIGLIIDRLNHQPHLLHQTHEQMREQFRRRLVDRLVEAIQR